MTRGPFLVMCGTTHVELDRLDDERLAVDVALAHDQVHHCSPWVQIPLEHVDGGDRVRPTRPTP